MLSRYKSSAKQSLKKFTDNPSIKFTLLTFVFVSFSICKVFSAAGQAKFGGDNITNEELNQGIPVTEGFSTAFIAEIVLVASLLNLLIRVPIIGHAIFKKNKQKPVNENTTESTITDLDSEFYNSELSAQEFSDSSDEDETITHESGEEKQNGILTNGLSEHNLFVHSSSKLADNNNENSLDESLNINDISSLEHNLYGNRLSNESAITLATEPNQENEHSRFYKTVYHIGDKGALCSAGFATLNAYLGGVKFTNYILILTALGFVDSPGVIATACYVALGSFFSNYQYNYPPSKISARKLAKFVSEDALGYMTRIDKEGHILRTSRNKPIFFEVYYLQELPLIKKPDIYDFSAYEECYILTHDTFVETPHGWTAAAKKKLVNLPCLRDCFTSSKSAEPELSLIYIHASGLAEKIEIKNKAIFQQEMEKIGITEQFITTQLADSHNNKFSLSKKLGPANLKLLYETIAHYGRWHDINNYAKTFASYSLNIISETCLAYFSTQKALLLIGLDKLISLQAIKVIAGFSTTTAFTSNILSNIVATHVSRLPNPALELALKRLPKKYKAYSFLTSGLGVLDSAATALSTGVAVSVTSADLLGLDPRGLLLRSIIIACIFKKYKTQKEFGVEVGKVKILQFMSPESFEKPTSASLTIHPLIIQRQPSVQIQDGNKPLLQNDSLSLINSNTSSHHTRFASTPILPSTRISPHVTFNANDSKQEIASLGRNKNSSAASDKQTTYTITPFDSIDSSRSAPTTRLGKKFASLNKNVNPENSAPSKIASFMQKKQNVQNRNRMYSTKKRISNAVNAHAKQEEALTTATALGNM
jgi:hypothetical protein